MRDPAVQVRHVIQPSAHTCGHACCAMVTGLSVDELVERFGAAGITDEIEAIILTECGILPIHVMRGGSSPPFPLPGAYFASVPSLNLGGVLHRVVVKASAETLELYDPNEGRPGILAYSRDALMNRAAEPRLHWYGESVLLQPMFGHRAMNARLDRYEALARAA